MQKTVVFSATGKSGTYVTRKLIEKEGKDHIVLAVRDRDKAIEIFGQDITIKTFQYQDSQTWGDIFEGVDNVYCIAPYKGDHAAFQFMQLLRLAKDANVKKIIYLSGRTTGDIPESHLNQIEQVVQQSELKYHIIRAGWFMQNFMNWYRDMIKEEDALFLPAAEGHTAFLDLEDLAEVVYRLFHSRKWDNMIIPLTNEESLNHFEVAEILSEVLDRPIDYMPLPGDEFIHAMHNRGWDTQFSEKLVYLYQFVRRGKEKEVSPYFREIMGRTPTTFMEFAKKNRDVWQ